MPEEIVKCFEEKDDTIRELASRAIIKIAGTEKGRAILAEDEQEDFLQKVRKLFDDPIVVIRANAYKCFLNMTKYTYGIDAVIRQNIVAVCVDQLIREKDESILILILQLLQVLNEGEEAPVVIQATEALKHLNNHLGSDNPAIRERSAMNLGSISYQAIGKDNCIKAGSIKPLSEMLTDPVSKVRTAASRALCSMA